MEAATKAKTPVLKAREVHIVGKITRSRRFGDHTYTTVVCPAADEYSRPQIIEVRSSRGFGQRDEVVSFIALLGGYEKKQYEYKDKSTGEISKITPVEMYLDYVGDAN